LIYSVNMELRRFKEINMQSQLSNQSGVAKALRDRVLFVEIDQETSAALAEYRPALKSALPAILTEFYAQVAKWPNLSGMFKDQSRMDYARATQEKHWMNLFEARFDAEYEKSVKK